MNLFPGMNLQSAFGDMDDPRVLAVCTYRAAGGGEKAQQRRICESCQLQLFD